MTPAEAAPAGSAVTVRLFAGLRERAGWAERTVPLGPQAEPPTPAALWEALELGAGALPPAIRVAVNRCFAGPDQPIGPGDEVAFLPPISGG